MGIKMSKPSRTTGVVLMTIAAACIIATVYYLSAESPQEGSERNCSKEVDDAQVQAQIDHICGRFFLVPSNGNIPDIFFDLDELQELDAFAACIEPMVSGMVSPEMASVALCGETARMQTGPECAVVHFKSYHLGTWQRYAAEDKPTVWLAVNPARKRFDYPNQHGLLIYDSHILYLSLYRYRVPFLPLDLISLAIYDRTTKKIECLYQRKRFGGVVTYPIFRIISSDMGADSACMQVEFGPRRLPRGE